MNSNTLSTAVALPDRELLERLPVLAAHERSTTAELVAHLAALRLRPSLYAAQGYGSLFAYCRQALRLSEDAASNRVHAARACLKFPMILDLLATGELSLSAVRILRPHLTMENHERVLGRARNARRVDIENLVAELAPRPDVPSSVRKLPAPTAASSTPCSIGQAPQGQLAAVIMGASSPMPVSSKLDRTNAVDQGSVEGMTTRQAAPRWIDCRAGQLGSACHSGTDVGAAPAPSIPRPIVQPLSPERYRVQFTIGQDAHDILRQLQTLLRHEIPNGDAGAIFEWALRLLHEEVQAAKFGRPRRGRIRPGADPVQTPGHAHSRYVPKAVARTVWYRDRGQCAFVSRAGRRCDEREFLELHHIQPWALNGPATAANLALRCRLHNAYEAEVVFGARGREQRMKPAG